MLAAEVFESTWLKSIGFIGYPNEIHREVMKMLWKLYIIQFFFTTFFCLNKKYIFIRFIKIEKFKNTL